MSIPVHRRPRTPRVLASWLVVLGIVASIGVGMGGAKPVSREYRIKAAFLSGFAKFIMWPDAAFKDDRSPIIIAVVGHDPFKEALDDLRGKTVGKRPIEIVRVERAQEARSAQIVYISERRTDRLVEILRTFETVPALTVGESEEFTRLGGIVRFYRERNRIRFEINPDAAERAGLKISSDLLKLARIVRDQRER